MPAPQNIQQDMQPSVGVSEVQKANDNNIVVILDEDVMRYVDQKNIKDLNAYMVELITHAYNIHQACDKPALSPDDLMRNTPNASP